LYYEHTFHFALLIPKDVSLKEYIKGIVCFL